MKFSIAIEKHASLTLPLEGPSSMPIIEISSSPVKITDAWLPNLHLHLHEKQILDSENAWLNDSIVCAAESLLSKQSKSTIYGSTLFCDKPEQFKAIPSGSPFVQVLHVNSSHWITVSIKVDGVRCFSDTAQIYDSARPRKVSMTTKKAICSFFKSNADFLTFEVMNVQGQVDGDSCGLFAIAFATELVYGYNPVVSNFDDKIMRPHLKKCLEDGYITRFPTRGKRRTPLGMKALACVNEKVFCVCKMPNDTSKPMVRCDTCLKWYHGECMSINCGDVKNSTWTCKGCKGLLNDL